MFDIGWTEMLVVGSLALIVVGPKDLPKMLRTFGQYVGKARGMAREFQRSMDDAAREADISDMKEMREAAQQLRNLNRPFDVAAAPRKTAASVAKPAAPTVQPAPAAADAPAAPAPAAPQAPVEKA